jgi:hypothetical protein
MRRIDQVLLDAAERGDLETAKGALEREQLAPKLECQHPKVWIDAASFGLPRWTREDLPHSYWKWVLLLNRKTS